MRRHHRGERRFAGLQRLALGLAVALSLTAMATDAEAQKRGKRVAADYFKQMIVLSDSSFPASFDMNSSAASNPKGRPAT